MLCRGLATPALHTLAGSAAATDGAFGWMTQFVTTSGPSPGAALRAAPKPRKAAVQQKPVPLGSAPNAQGSEAHRVAGASTAAPAVGIGFGFVMLAARCLLP